MTTISTRLAAASELTPELREECALMLGWADTGRKGMNSKCETAWLWVRGNQTAYGLPELDLTEIVAETRRKGLLVFDLGVWCGACHVILKFERKAKIEDAVRRKDENIQLCAMTALAMAIEGEK